MSSSRASPSPRKSSSAGKRHQARELALKVLFQLEGSNDDPEEVLRYHAAEGAADEESTNSARELVSGVLPDLEAPDSILTEASAHRKLDRMGKLDPRSLRS